MGFIAFFTVGLLCFSLVVQANSFHKDLQMQPQQRGYTVKGKVTDQKNVPLPGVTILLQGTSVGTATNHEGLFAFQLAEKEGVLVVSFVGYKPQSVRYTAGKELTVRLEEQLNELDEVQVVAYGEQSKRETLGSIATVKGDRLKDNTSSDLINKLQGQVAGVAISNPTSAPGAQGSIVVRGFNSLSVEMNRIGSDPLWVVDGVPVYTNPETYSGVSPLSTIVSTDIERIDVLKDAVSCAMYGSRAANGVILVTTKRGRYNEKFKVAFNVTQSYSFRTNLPSILLGKGETTFRREALRNYREAVYDYNTNSWHYVCSYEESQETGLHYDYFWNRGMGYNNPLLLDTLNPYFNNEVNLFRKFFQVGKITDASVRMSGGSPTMAYHIGLGYYKERGTLIHTGFNRLNLLSDFNFRPHPKVEGRLNFAITRTSISRSDKTADPYNVRTFNTAIPKIPSVLLQRSTVMPDIESLTDAYKDAVEENESYRFRTLLDMRYQIVSGLKFRTLFSFDYLGQHRNSYLPAVVDEYRQSYASGNDARNLTGLNENMLSYDRWLKDKHHIRLLAGISFQLDQQNKISGFGYSDYRYHFVTWNGGAIDRETERQLKEFNSDKTKSSLVSVYGRVAYSFREKLMFEANFRQDGSSRFGRNTRWGFFPSVATGYTFSEEEFMKNISHVLSFGKLRFTWGKTGKQPENLYAQGVYGAGAFTFQGKPTITTVELPNPDLSWEETSQYDAGLDLNFFNYRVGLTADYYYRYTDKLIYPVSIPGNYTGFVWQWKNAYSISNQGIELTLKADIIQNEHLTWNVSVNVARNWNRLEKSEKNRSVANPQSGSNVSVIGKPLNGLYVLDDHGFYTSQDEVPVYCIDDRMSYLGTNRHYYRPGDRKITDIDKNGIISVIPGLEDDRVYAGSPLPVASGGILTSLGWKGLDVSIVLPYSLGGHVLYAGQSLGTTSGDLGPVFADLSKIHFWQPGDQKAGYPPNRMEGGLQNFSTLLRSNVYRVNYLKFKQVTVGYTLPESVSQKIKLKARFFVTGENLFSITNYPGPDPESIDPVLGIDSFDNYPLSRKFTFGITLTL